MKYFSNIQVVMINTTLPANIGSAARAMHTMGLQHLTIVDPKLPIDNSSYAHAAGGTHILDNIKVVDSLDKAVAHSKLVFAASSRSRTIPRPVVNPTEAARLIVQFIHQIDSLENNKDQPPASNPVISILFGREDRGLTNDELAVANYHIQIDANPDYPVLNVASAVQVIASFFYAHFIQVSSTENINSHNHHNTSDNPLIHYIRQEWDENPITQEQVNQLNNRIIQLMQSLALADEDDLRLLPQRLSRLTSRVQLDTKEYQLINAVIGKLLNRQIQ